MGIHKQQRHATLTFLKFDRRHGHPSSRAPLRSHQLVQVGAVPAQRAGHGRDRGAGPGAGLLLDHPVVTPLPASPRMAGPICRM